MISKVFFAIKNAFIAVFILLNLLACEDLELTGSAKINGAPFTPGKLSITDTGTGIQIVLQQNHETVTLWLTEKKSGTFPVAVSKANYNQPIPPKLPEAFAVVEYKREDGTFYSGVSGIIEINLDGKEIKGLFNVEVETAQGDEVSITKGSFQGTLSQPRFNGCRVANIFHGERGRETAYQHYYGYGATGNLTSIKTQDSPDYISHLLFSYNGTVLVHGKRIFYSRITSEVTCADFAFLYNGDRISKINGDGDAKLFEYDTDGHVKKVIYENGNESLISYSEDGNVNTINGILYQYDSKPNYSELFMQALNNQPAISLFFGSEFQIWPLGGSKNNPTQIGTGTYAAVFQYEYGSNQYVVKRTETNLPSTPSSSLQVTYRTCQ